MEFTTENVSYYSLKFVDFVPNQLSSGNLFSPSEYKSLDSLLADIDKWIEAHPEVVVINVETVVLPNIHLRREEGSQDPELVVHQSDGAKARWHQFFRLWYK